MIDFDGDNLIITLASNVTAVSAQEIYSAWKTWITQGNNAAYLEAFRVIGGDSLGGGLLAGAYFFLQNQYGWRIKPPEEDIIVTISGNVFAENPVVPLLSSTVGDFNTSIRLQTSSLTQVVETDGGGVGGSTAVTAQDKADIAALVWDQMSISHQTTGTVGKVLADTKTVVDSVNSGVAGVDSKLDALEVGITAQDKLDIAGSVWDETTAAHTTAGTFGRQTTDTETVVNTVDTKVDALDFPTDNVAIADEVVGRFAEPGITTAGIVSATASEVAIQVSGTGLTAEQVAQLKELWQIAGLDNQIPLQISSFEKKAGDLQIQITSDSANSVTLYRVENV